MKLASIDSIKTKITIQVPGDYGKDTKEILKVEWKKLPVSETREMMDSIIKDEVREDDIILENLLNAEGLIDESGEKIEYSQEVGEQMLDIEYIRKPLIADFMKTQFGKEVLRQKNS